MPAPTRIFLGWDAPVLPEAARWLLDAFGTDLSTTVTVTPTGRTGRLLRALLVEQARHVGRPLSPPRPISATELDCLYVFPTEPAGPIARRLAWMEALARVEPEVLGALLATPLDQGDTPAMGRVAALLEDLACELAAGGYRFGEVEPAATSPQARLPDFADSARWAAAARLQARYEGVLSQRGMHDPDLALLDAVRAPGSVASRANRLVLVGMPALSTVARLAVMAHPDASILVAAPESEAHRFDTVGCPIPEFWGDGPKGEPVPIPGARLYVVDTPEDQASCAMSCLASLGGRYPGEDIVLVAPDDEVVPHLITAGRRAGQGGRGAVDIRAATGRPLAQTPPVTLVRAIRDFLSEGSFEAYAALVRHPDAEHRLSRLMEARAGTPAEPRAIERWLGVLDRYASQGLPDAATGPWRTSSPAHRGTLESLREGVDSMLEPLLAAARGTPAHWSRALLETLSGIYQGRRLEAGRPIAEQTSAACDRLRMAAMDLAGSPSREMTGAEALTLVLDSLGRASLPGDASRDSVEMVGWMDLGLDPAPVAIITGFNEGKVPGDPSPTPMLPERLREVLGLATCRSRLARDAYLMTLCARSRPLVFVIGGRRTVSGDPLRPSRLLFLCDDATATARLRVALGREACAWPARARLRSLGSPDASVERMPVRDAPLPPSLSVSSLACYLRCPYEFYLIHVLGAQEVEEPEREMSPRLFGSLIHHALAGLAGVDAGASDDPRRVAEALGDLVSDAARERVGARPRAAIRLQVDVARQRLELLAPHQADRARAGWRTIATERGVDRGGASLEVDGVPQGLHGRIDRIDVHPDHGLAVLDYKAGDAPAEPDKAHRRATGEARWKDLQLPMYRHLLWPILRAMGGEAAALGPDTPVAMGYVRLGASPELVGFEMAEWTAADLASADDAAREVVRSVRRREFQRAPRVPEHRIMAALCGLGGDGGAP